MTAKKRARTGRPLLQLNLRQLDQLAGLHCTYEEMAAVLGCSADTLSARFSDRIEKAREGGKMSLRRAQFKAALGGSTTMLIWLGKQHLGQRDVQEHAGEGGGPVQVVVTRRIVRAP